MQIVKSIIVISLTAIVASWAVSPALADLPVGSTDVAHWYVTEGAGTLSNAPENVPGLGSRTVLTASGSPGLGFVFRSQLVTGTQGKFVTLTAKSPGTFRFNVFFKGSDGNAYRLVYSSAAQPPAVLGTRAFRIPLSDDYRARYGTYHTYIFDLERDLHSFVSPSVMVAAVWYFQVAGPMTIAELNVTNTVDANGDVDGDFLDFSSESAAGSSPFLRDTDGDGLLDGIEYDSACGDAVNAGIPGANVDIDTDNDGLTNRVEMWLHSNCAAAGDRVALRFDRGRTEAGVAAGTTIQSPDPWTLVIANGSSASNIGTVSVPDIAGGPGSLPGYLNYTISPLYSVNAQFDVQSSKYFQIGVAVRGSDGSSYTLTYNAGNAAPALDIAGKRLSFGLANLGYVLSGATYTTVTRDLNADLARLVPGVSVAKIAFVQISGRVAVRAFTLTRILHTPLQGYGLSPYGFPADYSAIGAFFQDVAATLPKPAAMWNGPWRDDAVNGSDAGTVPAAANYVADAGAAYGFSPVVVFGWRSGSTLFIRTPGDSTNNWSNQDAAALYAQMVAVYLASHPVPYLFLGNENEEYFAQDPIDYANWITVYNAAYDAAKAVSPNTLIGPVFQFENLAGVGELNGYTTPHWEALEAHDFSRVDVVGITMYPFFSVTSGTQVPGDYLDPLFAHIGNTPVAITETGWPAETLGELTPPWVPSEQNQVDYLQSLVGMVKGAGAGGHDIRLINWLFLNEMVNTVAPPTRNLGWEIFGSVSMKNDAGMPRTAYPPWLGFSTTVTTPD